MATKEELEQQKNLADVNKLIFRMHADAVRSSPPDMRNPVGYDSSPRQDFAQTEPATTIKQYQALCEKMQESLNKAPNLDKADKDAIAAKLAAVTSDLKTLNSTLNHKFDDWMGNRRQLDKASWDHSFAKINKSFTALQDQVAEVSAKPDLPAKSLDAVQKSLDGVNLDNLQNKTFQNEVSRLKDSLTQQHRTDFGFLKATELGYGEGGTKKIWTKIHKSTEKKIEEEAKKLKEEGEVEAKIGSKDKKWNELLAEKGGPGMYRQEGSPYYMRVHPDGTLSTVKAAPENSFLSKVAQTVLMTAMVPFVPLLPFIPGVDTGDTLDAAAKKLRQFWSLNTFPKKMEEMMDFITLDPSGVLVNRSVEMTYDDCTGLRQKHLDEIMTTLALAEKKGIGFDISEELFIGISKVKGHEKVIAAIDAYKAKFKLQEEAREDAGKNLAAAPPTPSVPAQHALSAADKKTLSDHVVKLDEVKNDLDAVKPTDEMKVADLAAKCDAVKAAKDGIVQLAKVSHANENEIKEMEQALDKVEKVTNTLAGIAANNNAIQAQVKAGADLPISADPKEVDAHANYLAIVDDIHEKAGALQNRKEELDIQRQLEDNIGDLGNIDVEPDREEKPTMDFKTAVTNAVDHLNYAINRDDAGANKDKIEALKETVKQGVDKLSKNPAHKADADKLTEKVDKASEKLDGIKAAPTPNHP